MYIRQFRGVVAPCVLQPLISRLDSSLYPPLSCAFLRDLRLTLPDPSGRASRTSKAREYMVCQTLTELVSALKISACPSPVINSFSRVNERSFRQFCGIREFGDLELQLVLSATQFIDLDLRFTLTSLRPPSTTATSANIPKDLVLFTDFCPFLEEPLSTSSSLSRGWRTAS